MQMHTTKSKDYRMLSGLSFFYFLHSALLIEVIFTSCCSRSLIIEGKKHSLPAVDKKPQTNYEQRLCAILSFIGLACWMQISVSNYAHSWFSIHVSILLCQGKIKRKREKTKKKWGGWGRIKHRICKRDCVSKANMITFWNSWWWSLMYTAKEKKK